MLPYYLTPDAQVDITQIHEYTINQWGKAQADKYLSMIYEAIKTITKIPTIGKPRSDIDKNTHSFAYASHVIYYKVTDNKLVITAVLHKRMVPTNHLYPKEPL